MATIAFFISNDIRCWGGKEKVIIELSAILSNFKHKIIIFHLNNIGYTRTHYKDIIKYFSETGGKINYLKIIPMKHKTIFKNIIEIYSKFNINMKIDTLYVADFEDFLKIINMKKFLEIIRPRKTIGGLHSAYIGYNYIGDKKRYIDLKHYLGKKLLARFIMLKKFLVQNVVIHAINDVQVTTFKKLGFETYLVPNGIHKVSIPKEFFEDRIREKFHVVWLGRHTYEKGIDILLKLISLMKKHNLSDKICIKVFGKGPLTNLVIGRTDKGLEYKGFLSGIELYKELVSSHLFISTSRKECLPRSVLEALIVGLPTVLTDISGHSFIARLIPYIRLTDLNINEIIDNIIYYYELYTNEPNKYQRIRNKIASNASIFLWNNLIDKYLNLFLS